MDKDLNNNIDDLNSFVNSNDVIRYLQFLNFTNPVLYLESQLTSIEEMFVGENYVAMLLIRDTEKIGHFVVLRKDTETHYTYFDPLGDPPTSKIVELFDESGTEIFLESLKKGLQHKESNICGKFCLSFIMSGNLPITEYYEIMSGHKKFTPDQIVNNLYRINYADNVL